MDSPDNSSGSSNDSIANAVSEVLSSPPAPEIPGKRFYETCGKCFDPMHPNANEGRGKGVVGGPLSPNRGLCEACGGRGLIATEEGAQLLTFLKEFMVKSVNHG